MVAQSLPAAAASRIPSEVLLRKRTMHLRRAETSIAVSASLLLVAACSSGITSGDPSVEGGKKLPAVAAPLGPVDSAYVLASKVALPATKPEESHGIHNLFRLSPNVISGSEPHGEEAFQQLAAMGVKTVISVDGKRPDLEMAKKYGMRYVHIPVEYKGISAEEIEQLAKTYRELPAPFFVHCFHGKHRGPAAAEIGRLVLDGIPREAAIAEMRQWCGTAQEYEGLYRDVATRTIPTEAETKVYVFDFPAARSFGGFREAMISISRRDDNLKTLAKKSFALDPEHPDVDPPQEAAILADQLRISGTLSEIASYPDDFHALLKQSADLGLKLEEQLLALKKRDATQAEAAKKTYSELAKSCTQCHTAYRNK